MSSIQSVGSGFLAGRTGNSRPARPAQLNALFAENMSEGLSPEQRIELAHTTASALLYRIRKESNHVLAQRVVELVDNEGIENIAELWSLSEPSTLPGVLWRLYSLRTWIRNNAHAIAMYWKLAEQEISPDSVIAGIDPMPNPEEFLSVADKILYGVFTGDFEMALQQAAATARGIAHGVSCDIERKTEAVREGLTLDEIQFEKMAQYVRQAEQQVRKLERTARDFAAAGTLWKHGELN